MPPLRVTLWGGNPLESTPGAAGISLPGADPQVGRSRGLSSLAEMAERHNAKQILQLARDLVHKVQILIENK